MTEGGKRRALESFTTFFGTFRNDESISQTNNETFFPLLRLFRLPLLLLFLLHLVILQQYFLCTNLFGRESILQTSVSPLPSPLVVLHHGSCSDLFIDAQRVVLGVVEVFEDVRRLQMGREGRCDPPPSHHDEAVVPLLCRRGAVPLFLGGGWQRGPCFGRFSRTSLSLRRDVCDACNACDALLGERLLLHPAQTLRTGSQQGVAQTSAETPRSDHVDVELGLDMRRRWHSR